MKKQRITSAMLFLGIALVVAAMLLLTFSYFSQKSAADKARTLVIKLRQLMPEIQNGTLDDRVNMTMASMEVDGNDFCGIVEIPAYNTDLPLCNVWNKQNLTRYPCRYYGSIYDRSLIIGGSDNPGQFDFMQQITGGDQIYITDMTGERYRYVVSDVRRTTDVSGQILLELNADLVLFSRSTYALDYTLVICKFG